MNINQFDLINFNQGNESAFQKLFNYFYPSLCYFAERLTGENVESVDIVIDLFTTLWSKKGSFQSIDNLKAFLYISTRNRCLNYIQSRKKRKISEMEIKYLSEDYTNAALIDFEIINAGVMQHIYHQVEDLPPKCKEIFKMVFYEGLTTAEIAKKLGITTKTVLNQKLKAIQLLKVELLKKKLYLPVLFLCVVLHNRFMA
jgi:RNA polymerase sigma-70 factor (family 1)